MTIALRTAARKEPDEFRFIMQNQKVDPRRDAMQFTQSTHPAQRSGPTCAGNQNPWKETPPMCAV